MARFIKGKLYKVWWYDIFTDNQWLTLDKIFSEVDKMEPSENSWTYLGSRGNWYIFTSGINADGDYYDYHAIPKIVISKFKPLK